MNHNESQSNGDPDHMESMTNYNTLPVWATGCVRFQGWTVPVVATREVQEKYKGIADYVPHVSDVMKGYQDIMRHTRAAEKVELVEVEGQLQMKIHFRRRKKTNDDLSKIISDDLGQRANDDFRQRSGICIRPVSGGDHQDDDGSCSSEENYRSRGGATLDMVDTGPEKSKEIDPRESQSNSDPDHLEDIKHCDRQPGLVSGCVRLQGLKVPIVATREVQKKYLRNAHQVRIATDVMKRYQDIVGHTRAAQKVELIEAEGQLQMRIHHHPSDFRQRADDDLRQNAIDDPMQSANDDLTQKANDVICIQPVSGEGHQEDDMPCSSGECDWRRGGTTLDMVDTRDYGSKLRTCDGDNGSKLRACDGDIGSKLRACDGDNGEDPTDMGCTIQRCDLGNPIDNPLCVINIQPHEKSEQDLIKQSTPVTSAPGHNFIKHSTLGLSAQGKHFAQHSTPVLSALLKDLIQHPTPVTSALGQDLIPHSTPVTPAPRQDLIQHSTPVKSALGQDFTQLSTPVTSALGQDLIQHSTPVTSALGQDFTQLSTPVTSAPGQDLIQHSTQVTSALGQDFTQLSTPITPTPGQDFTKHSGPVTPAQAHGWDMSHVRPQPFIPANTEHVSKEQGPVIECGSAIDMPYGDIQCAVDQTDHSMKPSNADGHTAMYAGGGDVTDEEDKPVIDQTDSNMGPEPAAHSAANIITALTRGGGVTSDKEVSEQGEKSDWQSELDDTLVYHGDVMEAGDENREAHSTFNMIAVHSEEGGVQYVIESILGHAGDEMETDVADISVHDKEDVTESITGQQGEGVKADMDDSLEQDTGGDGQDRQGSCPDISVPDEIHDRLKFCPKISSQDEGGNGQDFCPDGSVQDKVGDGQGSCPSGQGSCPSPISPGTDMPSILDVREVTMWQCGDSVPQKGGALVHTADNHVQGGVEVIMVHKESAIQDVKNILLHHDDMVKPDDENTTMLGEEGDVHEDVESITCYYKLGDVGDLEIIGKDSEALTDIEHIMECDEGGGVKTDVENIMGYDEGGGVQTDVENIMGCDEGGGVQTDVENIMGYDEGGGVQTDVENIMGYDEGGGVQTDVEKIMGCDEGDGVETDVENIMGYDDTDDEQNDAEYMMGYDNQEGVDMIGDNCNEQQQNSREDITRYSGTWSTPASTHGLWKDHTYYRSTPSGRRIRHTWITMTLPAEIWKDHSYCWRQEKRLSRLRKNRTIVQQKLEAAHSVRSLVNEGDLQTLAIGLRNREAIANVCQSQCDTGCGEISDVNPVHQSTDAGAICKSVNQDINDCVKHDTMNSLTDAGDKRYSVKRRLDADDIQISVNQVVTDGDVIHKSVNQDRNAGDKHNTVNSLTDTGVKCYFVNRRKDADVTQNTVNQARTYTDLICKCVNKETNAGDKHNTVNSLRDTGVKCYAVNRHTNADVIQNSVNQAGTEADIIQNSVNRAGTEADVIQNSVNQAGAEADVIQNSVNQAGTEADVIQNSVNQAGTEADVIQNSVIQARTEAYVIQNSVNQAGTEADVIQNSVNRAGTEADVIQNSVNQAGTEADVIQNSVNQAGTEADVIQNSVNQAGTEADVIQNSVNQAGPEADVIQNSVNQAGTEADVIRSVEDLLSKYYCRQSKGLYECLICSKVLQQLAGIRNHVQVHIGNCYKCTDCHRSYMTDQSLKRHKKQHEDMVYKCMKCDARFALCSEKMNHQMEVHQHDGSFPCKFCDKGFKSRQILEEHIAKHTGERAFQCHICGMTMPTNYRLKRHLLTHSNPLQCHICDKRFPMKYSLKKHMRNHHYNEKPLLCDECGNRFAEMRNLNHHLQVIHGK